MTTNANLQKIIRRTFSDARDWAQPTRKVRENLKRIERYGVKYVPGGFFRV